MCIIVECEVMEGETQLCVCVCVCRERLLLKGETRQMGMRHGSVCKENSVYSWCINRWVCSALERLESVCLC